jgi:hypothetical protein
MELSRIYGFYCERIALLFVDDVVISECVEFVCPVESRSEVEGGIQEEVMFEL